MTENQRSTRYWPVATIMLGMVAFARAVLAPPADPDTELNTVAAFSAGYVLVAAGGAAVARHHGASLAFLLGGAVLSLEWISLPLLELIRGTPILGWYPADPRRWAWAATIVLGVAAAGRWAHHRLGGATLRESIRTAMQTRRRTTAAVAGLGLLFGLTVAAELVARAVRWGWPPTAPTVWQRLDAGARRHGHDLFVWDAQFGGRVQPSARFRGVRRRVDGTVIFDTNLEIDGFGRRATPPPVGRPGRFALLFGGSYVFGEGVAQDETLGVAVQQAAPGYRAYAYGAPGHGPGHALRNTELRNLRAEVAEPEGAFVYCFMDHHVDRAVVSGVLAGSWGCGFPVHELDTAGVPRYLGAHFLVRPAASLVWGSIKASALLDYVGVNWPPRDSASALSLTAALITTAFERVRGQIPECTGFVVAYPDSALIDELRPPLERAGLHVLALELPQGADRRDYFIPDDGHPTGKLHALVAGEIAAALAKYDRR